MSKFGSITLNHFSHRLLVNKNAPKIMIFLFLPTTLGRVALGPARPGPASPAYWEEKEISDSHGVLFWQAPIKEPK